MQLDKAIEAVLFYRAAPVKKSSLIEVLQTTEEELGEGLGALKERLNNGATILVITDEEVELSLSSEFDSIIEDIRKDELRRDIGRAGAETLAIIIYRGPITRLEIDRIRGVNSSYILRALETRGLVERISKGQRSEFKPTVQVLRHLGVQEKTELQDYEKVMASLENFEKQQAQEDN